MTASVSHSNKNLLPTKNHVTVFVRIQQTLIRSNLNLVHHHNTTAAQPPQPHHHRITTTTRKQQKKTWLTPRSRPPRRPVPRAAAMPAPPLKSRPRKAKKAGKLPKRRTPHTPGCRRTREYRARPYRALVEPGESTVDSFFFFILLTELYLFIF
jgi:hypothetical protein